jgi:chloride channel 6
MFLCLFFITTLTFGCGVSGASFIPCLLVGAIYGRFFGFLVRLVVTDIEFDPGAFALIGAGINIRQ